MINVAMFVPSTHNKNVSKKVGFLDWLKESKLQYIASHEDSNFFYTKDEFSTFQYCKYCGCLIGRFKFYERHEVSSWYKNVTAMHGGNCRATKADKSFTERFKKSFGFK